MPIVSESAGRGLARPVLAWLAWSSVLAHASSHEVVIEGSISGDDHQTYIAREFEVPGGIQGIVVDFEHDGADDRTVIDLGLEDPGGFRGWTGSNKSRIEISAFDSTPGYRNGPILAGTWALLLGVPNAREGVETHYKATITLQEKYRIAEALVPGGEPIEAGAGWYRGDLHAHTGHSDGYCLSKKDVAVPCPVHLTVEAGLAAGLDFLAVTDHNTLSHHQTLRELQPYFDEILLVPGREITTFFGHANMFGVSSFVDHRIGPTTDRSIGDLLDEVQDQDGLVSINHPALPSGEACMGCGWRLDDVDFHSVDAVEVINGSAMKYLKDTPHVEGGIEFWHSILDRGIRITAVGGSDNHDPELSRDNRQTAIGEPTTVVHAEALSQAGIFAGIRSGRVFVDLTGDEGRAVHLQASSGQATANMGGSLWVDEGATVDLHVSISGGTAGETIELVSANGRGMQVENPQITSADETRSHQFVSDGGYDWVRVNLRNGDGELLLLSNPVYLNVPGATDAPSP